MKRNKIMFNTNSSFVVSFKDTDVVEPGEIKEMLDKLSYSPFDPKLADKHLKKMLRHYKIKVASWSTSSVGWARVSMKTVKIPKPTDIDRFCVAMHELGHIIKGACKSDMPLFKSEYIAEMFALEQAAIFNWDATQYKERARRYIIMNIAKGHCRRLNLDAIEKEIKDFCAIDFESWKGKRVFVSGWGNDVYKEKPLEINISDDKPSGYVWRDLLTP